MYKFVVLLAVLAIAAAQDPVVPIVSQYSEDIGGGNFKFGFESGNGIKQDVVGSARTVDGADGPVNVAVQSGSFSYRLSDDKTVLVRLVEFYMKVDCFLYIFD
jgi:hypothetical protein